MWMGDTSSDLASTFAATEVGDMGFGGVACTTMSYPGSSINDLVMSASSITTEMYSTSSGSSTVPEDMSSGTSTVP